VQIAGEIKNAKKSNREVCRNCNFELRTGIVILIRILIPQWRRLLAHFLALVATAFPGERRTADCGLRAADCHVPFAIWNPLPRFGLLFGLVWLAVGFLTAWDAGNGSGSEFPMHPQIKLCHEITKRISAMALDLYLNRHSSCYDIP